MQYLVDLGRLVIVRDKSAQGALDLALLDAGGPEQITTPAEIWRVYRLDEARRQIVEVITPQSTESTMSISSTEVYA